MEIIKVKPWAKDQGDFVLINESDFDPAIHVKFDDEKAQEVKQERKPKSKQPQEA